MNRNLYGKLIKSGQIDYLIFLRRYRLLVRAIFCISVLAASVAANAQQCDPTSNCDVEDQGGSIMAGPTTVFLIFWLPNGSHYDTSASHDDATYENLMTRFYTDLSGSSYFNILSQYPSTCGIAATNQTCLGTITATALPIDTAAYNQFNAGALGTSSKPLQDSDVQSEVQKMITANGITPGQNTEFIVFTAAGIQECNSSFGSCTDSGSTQYCAYHGVTTSGAIYAFMPQVNSLGSGCQSGVSRSPNNEIFADQEIVILSHEFFESVSDPGGNAWFSNATGSEIGDNCNQQTGSVGSNGSNVTLNSDPYVVEQIWSNNDGGCVLSDSFVSGPTFEYTTLTGGDDLRGDSSATSNLDASGGASFQTVTLKPQSQPEWANNSTHVRVFQASGTQPAGVAITLTSHNGFGETDDNWNIQSLDFKVKNPNGSLTCEQTVSGNPAARLTGQAPTITFATPNCAPPPPPASINQIHVTIETGNDNARSDSELWATLPGEPSFCLKPSNNADPDGVCANGGSATDQNGKQSWDNWTFSTESFSLPLPEPATSLTSLVIKLIEHDSTFETDDNWDIQGITVTLTDTNGNSTTALNMSNPQNGDNCIARLKGSPNATTVVFTLDGTNGHTYVDGKASEAGQTTTCKNNGD